jgi:hypothetical protein
MLTQDGKLTDIGSWYMGGPATNNVPKKSAAAPTLMSVVPAQAYALAAAVAMWLV